MLERPEINGKSGYEPVSGTGSGMDSADDNDDLYSAPTKPSLETVSSNRQPMEARHLGGKASRQPFSLDSDRPVISEKVDSTQNAYKPRGPAHDSTGDDFGFDTRPGLKAESGE
jgi:hypothetical protein